MSLLIRGGEVVDGTGAPPFIADVEVRDGRITDVGRVTATDHEVIDADGLTVTPGFIDIHTHYDAQLLFEPTASPSSWHGVTTVITGNCGFTLGPAKPDDVDWLLHLLARVEGMSVAALSAGVDFAGGSLGDYLDRIEGRIGVNAATYVGHSAVRRHVMGDAASERTATGAEVDAMVALVHQAMTDGAIGFSSSQLDIHADHEGRPVPSNVAAAGELTSLAAVLAGFPGSSMQFVPNTSLPGWSDPDRDLVYAVAEASAGPVHVNMVERFPGFDVGWRHNLAHAEEAERRGLQVRPMFRVNPQGFFFRIDETFIFDDVPAMRDTLALPHDERLRRLADPATRAAIRDDLDTTERSVTFTYDKVTVGPGGDTIAHSAEERGVDPLDHMLDVALADDLTTVFVIDRSLGPEHTELTRRLVQHPLLMAGASDAGAHLSTFCGSDYTTRLLTEMSPAPLCFEAAVAKLTSVPASTFGLADRGVIRRGAAGDVVVLDRSRLGVADTRFVADLPTGARRLVHEPTGYEAVMVNGKVLLRSGETTGALPGAVLGRGGSTRR